MNRLALLLVSLPILAVAQTVAELGTYRDRRGDMQLRQFASSSIQATGAAGKRVLNFRVRADLSKGAQVLGTWRSKGMELFADDLSGTADEQVGGIFVLRSANVVGSVKMTVSQTTGTLDARTNRLQFAAGAAEDIVTLPEPLTLFQSGAPKGEAEKATSQTLRVTAKEGRLALDPDAKAKDRLRRATLTGSVRVIVRRVSKLNTQIDARADEAVITRSATETKIVLTGKVTMDGFDESNIGSVRGATRAEVVLDASNEVKSIDVTGGPATTTLRPAGGTQ